MPKGKKSEEQEQYEKEQNQREEEEKARLTEESIKEDEEDEEDKPEKPTEEQREKWRRDERKDAILDEIERQLEVSGRQDEQSAKELKQLSELREKLQDWDHILDNSRWNQIIKTYFRIIYALKEGMCAKTILTVECKDGTINFSYEFFDAQGRQIFTEFNDQFEEKE